MACKKQLGIDSTTNAVVTCEAYNGSMLVGEQKGADKLYYGYDMGGTLVSVNYNETEYYYT